MVEVEFNYKQNKINIQSSMNDIFEEIIQKYINKTNLDIKIYILYLMEERLIIKMISLKI